MPMVHSVGIIPVSSMTLKCAHLFTNERAPVSDHAPCS